MAHGNSENRPYFPAFRRGTGAAVGGATEVNMPARHARALTILATLSSVALPAVAHAEGAPPRDVKICVKIDRKSFTAEGTRLEAAGASAPGVASTPAPAAGVPGADATAAVAAAEPAVAPMVPTADFGSAPVVSSVEETAPSAATPAAGRPAASPRQEDLVDPGEADWFSVDPEKYLLRLMEYHVTHEPGFVSATSGCDQTIIVELYPVRRGWTVFARYTGNGREEKVDVLHLDELGTFAERVTGALLHDRSISQTLTRTTVLRADSEREFRQIHTRTHVLFGMGSDVRVGKIPTGVDAAGPATPELRYETPLRFTLGLRNKFRAWALDATGHVDAGLAQHASRQNPGGGHADYSVGLGLGLAFLAYAAPDAVNTLYYGAGGSFEVSRYQTIGAREKDGSQPRQDGLWGGGLDVDLVLGYEFMRTSAVHFFVQTTASLPAYAFESQNSQTSVRAWIPNASAVIGLLF